MKKSVKQTKKNSIDTALRQKAENNITIVICSIILYALIMFSVDAMANNSATVLSAHFIRYTLMFAGIIGAMGIAAYSAYKSNKHILKYAFMCLFISVSTAGILYCSPWGSRISVLGLIIAFIFTCIYAVLTDKKIYYSSKKARVIFRSAVGAVFGILFIMLVVAFFNNRMLIAEHMEKYKNLTNTTVDQVVEDITEPTL